MGMKTSSCWLGPKWRIVTKKLGTETEYTVAIDVESIAASDEHELPVVEKKAGKHEHYTRIEVEDVYPRFRTRSLGKTKEYLVQTFSNDVESGTLEIWWGGEKLVPPAVEVLETETGGKPTTWKKDVEFEVSARKVTGWACILGEGKRGRGRERAGFDLYRRGRVIVGRPYGYRPPKEFGEARNDLLNQRLYGQLNLDSFPVNHLKDDFLWDGLEDEFQDKLIAAIRTTSSLRRRSRLGARRSQSRRRSSRRPTTRSPMTSRTSRWRSIQVIEIMEVPQAPDPAVIEAKAARLRAQKIEPRIVEVGRYRFRIFHPVDMPDSEATFFASHRRMPRSTSSSTTTIRSSRRRLPTKRAISCSFGCASSMRSSSIS